jgi:hypothetical protein
MDQRRRGPPPGILTCLCAGRSFWAIHAPELAVFVRCASVNAGRRSEGFSAGDVVRHRAASSCAPSFQVATPGGHVKDRYGKPERGGGNGSR